MAVDDPPFSRRMILDEAASLLTDELSHRQLLAAQRPPGPADSPTREIKNLFSLYIVKIILLDMPYLVKE
jgi:hypothetical protein